MSRLVTLVVAASLGCTTAAERRAACHDAFSHDSSFANETEVVIAGYQESAMEPRLTADEAFLFWNDKPASDVGMQIHYAARTDAGTYAYVGPLTGANVDGALDGVPAVDAQGRFFFVSLRTYGQNAQTIFGGALSSPARGQAQVIDVKPADDAVSAKKGGTVDMDVDVSWDGTTLIASRAEFSPGRDFPDKSRLEAFVIDGGVASPSAERTAWLSQVNAVACRQYAASLSADGLELFSTVLPIGAVELTDFRLAVAKRTSTSEPFGKGAILDTITGNAIEGPTLSVDGKRLTFHRLDPASGRFKLYRVTRP